MGTGTKVVQVLKGRSNAFLLARHEMNVLVDTGRRRHRRLLMDGLRKAGIARLDALVLTHTHFDHAENAAFVAKEFEAKVIVHASEAGFLSEGDSPLPAGTVLPTRLIVKLFASRLRSTFAYEPCLPDVKIEDRFDLAGQGPGFYLLHTPGHSPGSVSLVVDDEIALVGDAMFGVFPHSIFPPFADDVEQLVSSWGRLLDTGCRLFIPGHGTSVDRRLVEKCFRKRKG